MITFEGRNTQLEEDIYNTPKSHFNKFPQDMYRKHELQHPQKQYFSTSIDEKLHH